MNAAVCAFAAAVIVLLLAPRARAQEEAVERLRAQVAAAPTDPSLRCQLAFALVGAATFDEARAIADAAVHELDALPRPPSAARRRLMGACLYNRGRALEGLGQPSAAARDYVRSLALRSNDAVLARLRTLAPGMRDDLPASALVLLDVHEDQGERGISIAPDAPLGHLRTSGGSIDVLPAALRQSDGFTTLVVFGIGWRGDVPTLVRLDSWTQEDQGGSVTIGRSRVIAVPGLGSVAVIEVRAGGGGACGRMDGFMDFDHVATLLVALDAPDLRFRALVTSERGCSHPVRMGIRVAPTGVTVRTSDRGELPIGEHPLAGLLRVGG